MRLNRDQCPAYEKTPGQCLGCLVDNCAKRKAREQAEQEPVDVIRYRRAKIKEQGRK